VTQMGSNDVRLGAFFSFFLYISLLINQYIGLKCFEMMETPMLLGNDLSDERGWQG
jgi:hypothetical protein